jgi:hypothetical protein
MSAAVTPRERLSYLLWSHLASQGWEGLDPSETLALADVALVWVVADLTAAADCAPDDDDYYRGRKAGLSSAAARFDVATPPGDRS